MRWHRGSKGHDWAPVRPAPGLHGSRGTPAPLPGAPGGGRGDRPRAENFLQGELIAPTDIVTRGGTLAIDVLVTDKFGLPVADATVYLYAGRGSTSPPRPP